MWWCAVVVVLVLVAGGGVVDALDLHLVDKGIANEYNARCLDGSLPAFYFSPASNKTHSNDWVLYFRGGGWCYTEAECAQRAKTQLGSSTQLGKTFNYKGGYLAPDSTVNPVFSGFNRVLLWYCDGASFSGNRAQPVVHNNQTLHYRGFANLRAILATLAKDHGFGSARQVLLSGGSAGGLATFLHADTVRAMLPRTATAFKASPVSGFFLEHDDAGGQPLYPDRMRNVFAMQNCSAGVDQSCIKANAHDPSACMFAQHTYPHMESPIFLLQSLVDAWQMGNVFPANASWKDCANTGEFQHCSTQEIAQLNAFGFTMLHALNGTRTFSSPGNGGFFYSCRTHVAAQGSAWEKFTVEGVVMRDAANAWWLDSTTAPAAKHTHLQPKLLQPHTPHQTNPTCS
ncbi:hypothetical protein PTSG_08223 [Salpingoeca rosetta]|uniref:Pectin acetylesterase n=1 Tax=Salpingoeca rosetta (strain ATCC 50818 / BSB-021) TaxID=946362 RepID=F2UIC7_SALR5|nr:uncharacterized protein PTSG_08223 [Salpingoeca rosetta]EGD76876.1 hypothetical protein PTSG_08223 [Salpingoeca rosetta]|eukprot:XP_004991248.1 hypothetical protein PTSG_08223 [Salpingoeca rosetta]